jgi:hypothetical protein
MPNSKSSKSSVTPSNLGKRRASEVSKSQEFLLESASAKLFDSINIATDGEKTIPFAEVSDLEKPQAILFNALSSTAEEGVAEVQPLMSIAELKSNYEGFLTKDLQLPSNDFEKTELSMEVFTASSAQEQKKEGGVESRLGDKHGVSASRLLDDSSRGPR